MMNSVSVGENVLGAHAQAGKLQAQFFWPEQAQLS